MKRSYDILSAFLDGIPIPVKRPMIQESERYEDVMDITRERCLFDYGECVRKVSAMKLSSCENIEQLRELVGKFRCKCTIIIVLDFSTCLKDSERFFLKRVLLIFQFFSTTFLDSAFLLSAPSALIPDYRRGIDEVLVNTNNLPDPVQEK